MMMGGLSCSPGIVNFFDWADGWGCVHANNKMEIGDDDVTTGQARFSLIK
jgi:hypothetical protein